MNHIEIMQKLEAAGHRSFMVGGCVRDKLLGLPVKDYDLATDATPQEMQAIFSNAKILHSRCKAPVVSIGEVEVATFRSDSGTRGEASFREASLIEDAERRDFTINALYEDLEGKVLDPTGEGLADLSCAVINFVGDGRRRIKEDPIRALRGIRIAAQKNFDLSLKTAVEILLGRHYLKDVAGEQVGRELMKLLSVPSRTGVERAFRNLAHTGCLHYIFPELDSLRGLPQNIHHLEGDAFEHTLFVLINVPSEPVIRMAALLHDVGKSRSAEPREDDLGNTFYGHEMDSVVMGEEALKRFACFSKVERNEILFCVENHMRIHYLLEMQRKKAAPLLRSPFKESLLKLAVADSYGKIPADPKVGHVLRYADKFAREDKLLADLGIDARLLLSLGEVPGKVLGDKLRMMQNLLDKDPTIKREYLLKSIGYC